MKLNNERLANEVITKTKELASTSMQLLENSGALIKVRDELAKLDTGDDEDSNLKRINNLLKDIEKTAPTGINLPAILMSLMMVF
ncbi:hypothetical protein KUH03_37960 [Sphingobacterium sp. E70]|uniref:hypothetical protein n=1 Tax=Sphingobacterium sp. E70 TaxID=2853439 RepID=UPI00211B9653|nr:hypothetical protein [Sphingobacterium sp. E70]ULT24657.1 hypothetical protein KUH03_37960 [Sphingobacterium sp. E70]